MINKPNRSTSHYLASLGAIAILATACGGGPGLNQRETAPAHAGFVTAVNQVCARAVAAHNGHDFPLSDFNPDHPNPDQLPIVASYFARYGQLPQVMAALHTLTPPASDAAAWQQLLAIADHLRANAQRQITAARARDITAFVTTVHATRRLTDQLVSAGTRLGFAPNSACDQVFG